MRKQIIVLGIIFILILSGLFLYLQTLNVDALSSWKQDSYVDFNNGTMDNVIVTSNDEIELAIVNKYLEDNFTDESKIAYKKDVFLDPNMSEIKLVNRFNRTFDGGNKNRDGGYSVQETSDGGYIITGDTFPIGISDMWLIKTDVTGEIKWDWIIDGGNNQGDYGCEVQETSDGGYIIGGTTESFPTNDDFWLYKTDSSGKKAWVKKFDSGYKTYDHCYSIQETSDGGYILCGYTHGSIPPYMMNSSFLIIKTDSSGNKQWSQMYDNRTLNVWERFWCSIQETSDGGYIFCGNEDFNNLILIKTNSSGNLTWNRTFNNYEQNYGCSVQETSDGGYILVGTFNSGSPTYADLFLHKTDSLGKPIWNNTYGGIYPEAGFSVQETSDGGYIITGRSQKKNATKQWDVILLLKTNSIGVEEWSKTFGNENSIGRSVKQTSDGGYIITGYTYKPGNNEDVWLIKTNDTGCIDSNIGKFTSINLFEGREYFSIEKFGYSAKIPTGTVISVQFSRNMKEWYNSNGQLSSWDSLSNGANFIYLTNLTWIGSKFYYRMNFTSSNAKIPRLQNISINYTRYLPYGTFISESFNSNENATWKTLNWTEVIPIGTDINFQIRTASSQTELSFADFIGPDGTSLTYYNKSDSKIWDGHNYQPWIQYKVNLTTTQGDITPILQNINISFNYLPSKPTLVSPVDDIWINNKTPIFNWNFFDLDGIQDKFQVIIDNDKTFESIDYDSGFQNSSFQIWQFPNGTNYEYILDGTWFWKVRTMDNDGDWGLYSLPSKMMIDTKIPNNLSISINEDNDFTNSMSINLDVEAKDLGSGISKMALSTDRGNFTSWEPFKNEKNYNLTPNDGNKIIYYTVQDHAGNIAEPVSDSIILDTIPPIELEIIINDGAIETNSSNVYLKIGAIDNTSGLSKVSFSNDGSSWTPWENYSKDKNHTLTSGDGENRIYYKVMDNAGNIAEPVSASIFLNTSVAEVDTDGDNIPDFEDLDDDNDDYLDSWEEFLGTDSIDNKSKPLDTDNDKEPDGDTNNSQPWMDKDDDNDGYLDIWENFMKTNPLNKTSIPLDTDNDGKPNGDNTNSETWMDLDDDGDGYSDAKEIDSGTDPLDSSDYPSEKESKAEDYTMILVLAVIIIIIIIFLILFALIRRKRLKTIETKDEEEEEIEEWEEESEEEEGEEETEKDIEEWDEEEYEEEIEEEELEDLKEEGFEEEPEMETELMVEPGKMPKDVEEMEEYEFAKGKFPEKGALDEGGFGEELFDDTEVGKGKGVKKPGKAETPIKPKKGKLPAMEEEIIVPEFIDKDHEIEPEMVKVEKSTPCGVCLGAIKTGLMAIKCHCGKYYHESCGIRLGECPKCERKFKLEKLVKVDEDLEDIEELEESELSAEEFEQKKEEDKKVEREEMAKIIKGLEKRLAKGEISEDTYLMLRKKYEK